MAIALDFWAHSCQSQEHIIPLCSILTHHEHIVKSQLHSILFFCVCALGEFPEYRNNVLHANTLKKVFELL